LFLLTHPVSRISFPGASLGASLGAKVSKSDITGNRLGYKEWLVELTGKWLSKGAANDGLEVLKGIGEGLAVVASKLAGSDGADEESE
jgi:hypothetical protein